MDKEYNGWKNYETWNVSMWLDLGGYADIIAKFLKDYDGVIDSEEDTFFKQKEDTLYKEIVEHLELGRECTEDGIHYLDSGLDYAGLSESMVERYFDGYKK